MLNSKSEQQFQDFNQECGEWTTSKNIDSRIKLGFDVHGVLDTYFEQYHLLISNLDRSKFEIHIITGIKERLGLQDCPHLKCLDYDKWFSIHQHCEDLGINIAFDHLNRPLIDPSIWDIQKAEYCEREGILFMFDDSPHYGKHMKPSIVYLQQHNYARTDWRYTHD